jgi:hypothetical protein
MSHRHSAGPPAQHVIFRTEGKPLRFTGVLLGSHTILDEENGESDTRVRLFRSAKGSLIWAWDRIEHGYDDPEPENIQRSDALVISATEPQRAPAEVAAEAWDRRPMGNARLADASIRVWHEAAPLDEGISKVFYIEVE